MSTRTEAAMQGERCTCERDVNAQTSTIDPDCPFHGDQNTRLAGVDSATGEDTAEGTEPTTGTADGYDEGPVPEDGAPQE